MSARVCVYVDRIHSKNEHGCPFDAVPDGIWIFFSPVIVIWGLFACQYENIINRWHLSNRQGVMVTHFEYFSTWKSTFCQLQEKKCVLSTRATFSVYRLDRHHLRFNSMRRQPSSLENHSFWGLHRTLHYPKAAKLCTKNRTKNEKEDVFSPSVQSERSVSGFICLSQQIWSRNERGKPLSE